MTPHADAVASVHSETAIDLVLAELVTISSVTPRDEAPCADRPGEQALAEYVVDWLSARGVTAALQEALPGRPTSSPLSPGRASGPCCWKRISTPSRSTE